jgi:hypothetical protein
MRVHLLGASNPAIQQLLAILDPSIETFVYSRSPLFLDYDSLIPNIIPHDIVISTIPVHYFAKLLDVPAISESRFEYVKFIALSSMSIYSKLGINIHSSSPKSFDYTSYLPFLYGEHRLLSLVRPLSSSIMILRCPMIWGCHHDSNITFLFGFIRKFRIFPVASTSFGLRCPVHYHQLSSIFLSLITERVRSRYLRIHDLVLDEIFSFDLILSDIFSKLGYTVNFIVVPSLMIRLLAPLIYFCMPRSRLSLALGWLSRQHLDLVYNFNVLDLSKVKLNSFHYYLEREFSLD